MRILFFSFVFALSLGLQAQQLDPLSVAPEAQADQNIWVDSLYHKLNLDQKIGQLFMPMVFTERDSSHFKATLDLVEKHDIGGLIFSLGGPVVQSQWLNAFQAASKTPLLIAMDAEWGGGMRLDSIQDFPWQMTLGAVQDTLLLRKIGRRMGEQEQRLGIHYSFGPVLDLNTNPANPIIGNRSLGEDPARVSLQAEALMKGHHDAGILTSGKHFPGHGDTAQDSHKTLPTINFSADRIREVELYPYRQLIKQGLSSVMVAHLNVPSLAEEGIPSSLSKDVIQGILKDELQFKGLIVTDALNMKGVSTFSGTQNIDLTAFLAGHDMLLISENIPAGIAAIKKAYQKGIVSEDRLSHSVKKVLKAKYKVGLHHYAPVALDHLHADLNTSKDTLLIAQAFEKALTLLKNEAGILPLSPHSKIGHIALGDDDSAPFSKRLKTLLPAVSIEEVTAANALVKTAAFDTLVISFHRSNANPWKAADFSSAELELIQLLAKHKKVILDVFVKPYALRKLQNTAAIEAILLSYQNSALAQALSAEALVGLRTLSGSLPVSVNAEFKMGSGIQLEQKKVLSSAFSPAVEGFDAEKLNALETLAEEAIAGAMTPGMQLLVAKSGKIVYQKSFGFQTYKKQIPVKNHQWYDLASVTKILGTLPLVMQEVDQGKLNLESTIGDLLPQWKASDKSKISIKEMLSHYAQLTPWIPFYEETLDDKAFPHRKYYSYKASSSKSIPVAKDLFLKTDFEDSINLQIQNSPLLDTLTYRYSDLPYYILKLYFEQTYKTPFETLVQQRVFDPLGLDHIGFNPYQRIPLDSIVPSEDDRYFRQQALRGYVHDMGAAMQGGVGGHAGLFANAKTVAQMMQMYLQGGQYGDTKLLKSETIDLFNHCYYCDSNNRRGVGFDKPQFAGTKGSTCDCVSSKSFGHLGFTGTYAWADPEKEIVFVLLANRTFPSMDNKKFISNDIRTRMQGLVYEALIY